MNSRIRLNTWQAVLTVVLLLSFAGQLSAVGARAKPHRHAAPARQVVPADSGSADVEQQQESQESSAPEATPSADDNAKPAKQEGISLFNIAANVLEIAIIVVLVGAIPLSATVLFCAMIWHLQKALNGGKKPSIG